MFSGLGISLFLAGLVVITLAWAVLRMLQPILKVKKSESNSLAFPESTKSNEAVILLQPGGRLEHLSDSARDYFDLREDDPYDLESLARRVRPTDDFLDLCIAPGMKRVSISGRLVEMASFEVPGVFPMMLISLRRSDLSTGLEQGNEISANVLRAATEFSQSISASLDLETTARSIFG